MSTGTDAAYHEGDHDGDKGGDSDRGDKAEKGGTKQKPSGTAKTKDLSHVPCKFFKVGGCTAGSSCPFSHVVPEPGQKEVCTWFVKGNCKFGHKCALAHVLPGQSMAMDRKNKKAAQTAASASSDRNKTGGKVTGKKDAVGSGGNKLPLLAGGSTAPTRILNTPSGSSKPGRPPINMPLKATISPSAPAPPLKDTDFASFDPLDGLNRDLGGQSLDDSPVSGSKRGGAPVDLSRQMPRATSVDHVPLSPSSHPSTTTTIKDFGPIGSPPNYRVGQPISPLRTNGSIVSPAISPRNQSINHGSPSHNGPLSAPGNQEYLGPSSFSMRGQGIPASLGSGLAMKSGRRGFDGASGDIGANSFTGLLSGQLSSSVSQTSGLNGLGRGEYDITIEYDDFSGAKRNMQKGMETAVEDEDLEDFLPSSLNDLLTPEERSRRMSRSNSGQKSGISALASVNLGMEPAPLPSGGDQTEVPTGGNGNPALGHRYSHSVPAPTLLADIKSIWSDSSVSPMPSSPLRVGIPSATISATLGSGNVHADEVALSMSMGSVGGTPSSLGMISPSNASAAFLPSLHKHYLDAKAKQAQQAQLGNTGIRAAGLRGTSNPIFANNGPASSNSLASSYLQPLGAVGLPSSVSNSSNLHMHIHGNTSTTYRTTPSPFDLTQTLHQPQPHAARPISNLTAQASKLDDSLLAPTLLSPGSRAYQSHAPGQSLPQGLAAGYSRIHALPPLTHITSPSNGAFIPGSSPGGGVLGNNSEGPFGEWTTIAGSSHQLGVSSTLGGQGVSGSMQPNPGLDSMFSRFSYAATARHTTSSHAGALSGAPPGLARNVSGGKYNPLSPLSGPVTTRDDDILFDMDK